MGRRYQGGYLRLSRRKTGPNRWEFLWREVSPLGTIVRRKAIIGIVEQYQTASAASDAVNGLRVSINEDRNRQWGQNITVADLVDHYKRIELSNDSVWHAYATRIAYQDFIERYVRPRWGTCSIRQVRTVDVEMWLRQLRRVNGLPLANSTKAKIRSLMSVLFNHAIRYEWLEQGKNPTTLVRQSAKRMRVPDILEVEEISALLAQLDSPFRLMVLVAATTGLRRSELFALRWSDVDFLHLEIRVMRSIFRQVIGDCKTEGSRRPVPIDASLAADLWIWREATPYRGPDDWIFASRHTHGLQPFWPDMVLTKVVRPAAKRAGIEKRIGWHTFRHSFSTLLVGNGENVKVIQELMRHASARCTMDIYSQAKAIEKRIAHQRVLAMIRQEAVQDSSIPTIQASA